MLISARRDAEGLLIKAAELFSITKGKYREFCAEIAYKPDYSTNDEEWQEIRNMKEPPQRMKPRFATSGALDPFTVCFHIVTDKTLSEYPLCLRAALSERHIGVDQGLKNFAIVAIDRFRDKQLEIVAAENYHFDLPSKFQKLDLLDALMTRSDLLNWMQISGTAVLPIVDRVIVHIEMMDKKNANQYEFTIGLGRMLQARAPDIDKCIVKLSLAKNLRANGPMFRMGTAIVAHLNLTPVNYAKKRFARGPVSHPVQSLVVPTIHHDTESNQPTDEIPAVSANNNTDTLNKKKVAAAIFKYIVDADHEQEEEMGIVMNAELRSKFKSQLLLQPNLKLDDLGDSFLHAVNELLCGSTNFKQLVPATPSRHSNRSVALLILPQITYWVVLNCTWNRFKLEDLDMYESLLEDRIFSSTETEEIIKKQMPDKLKVALTQPSGIGADGIVVYAEVEHIKIIIKQLQGFKKFNLSSKAAGKLQDVSYRFMKELASTSCSANSEPAVDRNDKQHGHVYYRIDVASGKRFEVMKSTGKHLNAIQVFYEWAYEHVQDACKERNISFKENQKFLFFNALKEVALSDQASMEMLQLSDVAIAKLSMHYTHSSDQKKRLADLILIAINLNQEPVRAIAANYRRQPNRYVRHQRPPPASVAKSNDAHRNEDVMRDNSLKETNMSTNIHDNVVQTKITRISGNEYLESDSETEEI